MTPGSGQNQALIDAALRKSPPPCIDLQRPTSELLLWGYAHGIFPMADPDTGKIDWFSPDPRGIIPLGHNEFIIPRNLAREIRKGRFEMKLDTSFEQVMRACGHDRNDENRSWINETIIRAYGELYRQGLAHSVEAWRYDQLVGGLYGVHLGGAFFGESMFSRPDLGGSNSSKVCLVHLVQHLRARGFALLDTQFWTPHLDQFGCIEIPREEYLAKLQRATRLSISWL